MTLERCFQNGDEIQLIENQSDWANTTGPGYVVKNGVYLYNYYAASDNRNICPLGYRVPSSSDWQVLFDYVKGNNSFYQLGVDLLNGGITGFNASNNTYRGNDGQYYENDALSRFQTSTQDRFAIIGNINVDNPFTQINNINSNIKNAGYCVRCIKD